jgi:transcription initiation factor TFIIIB Brf1 subunit/transcription initiation factor TFIIB
MDKILNLEDIQNITEGDLREIFDDIDFNDGKDNIEVNNKDICFNPNCDKKDSIIEDYAQGNRVCQNCGQVIGSIIDSNPEWRQYDDDKGDNSRCSQAINKLLPQSSLGTTIGGGSWKSRLKTLHGWSAMPYKERSLNIVFKEIHARCQKVNIVKCIEDDAKIMYKTISESKHLKGKNKGKYIIIRGANRRSLIAACVFFACKKKGMTRSPKEISDLFELKYTEITKGCKNFMKMLKLKKMGLNMGTTQPEHFIIRFCNELKIKKEYVDEAIKISKNIKKLNIASDHTPFSVATGSILLMATCNGLNSITKRRLANKFAVSEVTITKAFNKLKKYVDVLRDDKKTDDVLKQIFDKTPQNVIPDAVKERLKKFGMTVDDLKVTEPKNMVIESIINNEDIIDCEDEDEIDELDNDLIDDNKEILSIDDVEDKADFYKYIHNELLNVYTRLADDNDRYVKLVTNFNRK